MAHFARIEDGLVREVIVVHNNEAPNEASGQAFIASMGLTGQWVQTSYNGNPINGVDRGPYAGIGYLWDGERFIPPASPDADAV